MQIEPVNLVGLVSVILGISVVLIPVLGLTARYALNPTVEALSRMFESRGSDESLRILERRVELQDQEIDALQSALRSLTESHEFDRQLASPARSSEQPSGS